jgi:integrase
MPQLINRLDALKVRRAEKPGYYADGAGLYMQVAGSGSRSWIFRFTLNGRTRDMGLGSVGTFSLAEARQAALEARKLQAAGIDPIERRNAQRAQERSKEVKTVTFRQEANAYIDAHRSGWKNAKHAEQWRSTLETYVYPTIGDVAVDDVDTRMLVRILEPIWSKKAETANRVRGRIERILSRAASRGHRSGENPARWRGHLDNILPARSRVAPVRHHAALPYSELGTFMRQLRSQAGVAARALEFTILCATRTVETIGASWSEIDLDRKVWTIPARRMKAKRDHRIPLSDRATEILGGLDRRPNAQLVFTKSGDQAHLSNGAMLALLDRMGRSDITTHGFRSTFRDWVSEQTSFAPEVAEMALAHAVQDKVEAAYRRGDLFEKRRKLMEVWAEFSCDALKSNIAIAWDSSVAIVRQAQAQRHKVETVATDDSRSCRIVEGSSI